MPSPRTAPRLGSCTVTASESGARKGTAWPPGMGSSDAPLFLRGGNKTWGAPVLGCQTLPCSSQESPYSGADSAHCHASRGAHLGRMEPSPTNATRPRPGSWSRSACGWKVKSRMRRRMRSGTKKQGTLPRVRHGRSLKVVRHMACLSASPRLCLTCVSSTHSTCACSARRSS